MPFLKIIIISNGIEKIENPKTGFKKESKLVVNCQNRSRRLAFKPESLEG
jgi:hypothetical protein